jgi:hypothetical protein
MLSDALTNAPMGVELGESGEEIALGLGSRAALWISFLSDCVLGITLYVCVAFGLNGIWKSEEDFRLSFVSLVLVHFIWKGLGQRGSVHEVFGLVASLGFGGGALGDEAGDVRPPLGPSAPNMRRRSRPLY